MRVLAARSNYGTVSLCSLNIGRPQHLLMTHGPPHPTQSMVLRAHNSQRGKSLDCHWRTVMSTRPSVSGVVTFSLVAWARRSVFIAPYAACVVPRAASGLYTTWLREASEHADDGHDSFRILHRVPDGRFGDVLPFCSLRQTSKPALRPRPAQSKARPGSSWAQGSPSAHVAMRKTGRWLVACAQCSRLLSAKTARGRGLRGAQLSRR